jgi:hypothetical protein
MEPDKAFLCCPKKSFTGTCPEMAGENPGSPVPPCSPHDNPVPCRHLLVQEYRSGIGQSLPEFKNCSGEIMLIRKLKEGLVSDNDLATGVHRLVGACPEGAWLWIVLRLGKRKIQPLLGVKGACPPWAASPTGGERGHPRNFHANSKTRRDFP